MPVDLLQELVRVLRARQHHLLVALPCFLALHRYFLVWHPEAEATAGLVSMVPTQRIWLNARVQQEEQNLEYFQVTASTIMTRFTESTLDTHT